MFIEACILAAAFGGGSELLKKFRNRMQKLKKQEESAQAPAHQKVVKPLFKRFERFEKSLYDLKTRGSDAAEKNLPVIKRAIHLIQTISAPVTDPEQFGKEVDRSLFLSLAAAGISVAGALFRHLLSFIAALLVLYASIPIFRAAFYAVFKEKRISRIALIDSFAVIAMIVSGYYIGASSASAAYFGAQKLRMMAENQSKKALHNIFGDQPRCVWILKDGVEIESPLESLQALDIVVFSAGELIAADGIVVWGNASADQHILTGESQPAEKGVGDRVFAGTLLLSGKIHIQVEKAGKETVAAKIAEILENTARFTDVIESAGQEAADTSVIPALALSAGGFPFVGAGGSVALLYGDFLVNMRLTAPIGMLNFLQIASQEGILIKDGRSLQLIPRVDTVVFDKTGTLTSDQPHVSYIHTFNGRDETAVLSCAAAAEYRQSHPVARAILEEARNRSLTISDIDEVAYRVGYGITAETGGKKIQVGSDRFMLMQKISLPESFDAILKQGDERGCSFVCVAVDGCLIGAVELEPTVRPETAEVLRRLKRRNIKFCIISGDHEKPTRALAAALGIDSFFAEVLPENKADLIESLRKQGRNICFVGDGINDSIALKKADVSVSMRGASTIATDSAQIVLPDGSLKKLPDLFDLAYNFQDTLKNTFFAVSTPMILGIGGVFFAGLGLHGMIVLFITSVASGAAVSITPLLTYRKEKDK